MGDSAFLQLRLPHSGVDAPGQGVRSRGRDPTAGAGGRGRTGRDGRGGKGHREEREDGVQGSEPVVQQRDVTIVLK